jgi:dedicated sortase system histidine kinase
MSLRLKLLLAALCTLALPWAGWQFVRQTERLLREGQEQAWLTSTALFAKMVQARGVAIPAGAVLYAQRAREPISVDGYADDWSALRPYAQALGPASDAQKLRVLSHVAMAICICSPKCATRRARFDPADPRSAGGDHVTLVLEKSGATRRYRLIGAAPGAFDAAAQGDAPSLPDHLAGAMQEDGSGYRIELRIPREFAPDRIGIGAFDSAQPSSDAPELRALVAYDDALARALQPMLPPHARARLVAADGWVIADAGQLAADGFSAREHAGGFSGWIYRHFVAPAFDGSSQLDGNRPRVDASEVWQALSGVAATSWRPADGAGAVVLAVAIPLDDGGATHGALVLEQANPALPLLADRALASLVTATLVALAIAAAILLLFGASLSMRVRRLRNATERAMRASGRLDGPMPLADSRDELGDLARSFRKLLDEVGASTDYLRTLASKLSHELNTPLAIVKSSLDNIEHHALPPDARPYLARARDGADRLGAIVRAMSEASRIERAIASAEAEDFDLRALVSGCAGSYRALAAPRELRLALPDAPVPFHGAPELIAQALDKLFDNACSFTPADGWIALSLTNDAGAAPEIRVANAGPLLPAAMQDRLFDSLVSLREGGSRAGAPHLGLGLYVVRLVAELHRGAASAVNLADGSGVEFKLDMPGMPRRRLSEGTNHA